MAERNPDSRGTGRRPRPSAWESPIELIRQAFPAARKSIQFFRVGEVQARGAIHYHLALRGLQWLPKGLLQKLTVQAGFGYIVDVRLLRNIGGGVNYFAKYLLKDVKAWPTGRRVWSCSAGWRVKWSPRSPLAGKFPTQLLSTGEEFLSVSPWRYDRRESEAERRRLREGVAEDEWRSGTPEPTSGERSLLWPTTTPAGSR